MFGTYDHLGFTKHWELGGHGWYVLGRITGIVEAIHDAPLPPAVRDAFLRVSLQKGAQATTAIEGNTLTDAEVALVAAGNALSPSKHYQEVEVRNVLDAMNQLLRELIMDNRAELVSPGLLRRFHQMVGKDLGVHFDAIPGQFRTDSRIVGPYRCPDPRDVPDLVSQLCQWLQREFGYQSGAQQLPQAIIEAVVAHVYLEWIHPFGDGNGRTGRLLEFYILLRAGMPNIASHILSNYYNLTRVEYYRQLEVAQKSRDLSGFLHYALQGLHDGLVDTLDRIQATQFATAWMTYVHEVMGRQKIRTMPVLRRRRTLVLHMEIDKAYTLDELRLVSPQVARDYATLSDDTLRRDVAFLQRQCELIVRRQGRYVVNAGILVASMPARRL